MAVKNEYKQIKKEIKKYNAWLKNTGLEYTLKSSKFHITRPSSATKPEDIDTSFLSQTINSEKLTTFINSINGKDGNLCHLVTVPPGPLLSDALISSPILQGEDGAGPGMEYASEYGFDPNSDPELALVSGSKSDQYQFSPYIHQYIMKRKGYESW